jgi:hypothetical protein
LRLVLVRCTFPLPPSPPHIRTWEVGNLTLGGGTQNFPSSMEDPGNETEQPTSLFTTVSLPATHAWVLVQHPCINYDGNKVTWTWILLLCFHHSTSTQRKPATFS